MSGEHAPAELIARLELAKRSLPNIVGGLSDVAGELHAEIISEAQTVLTEIAAERDRLRAEVERLEGRLLAASNRIDDDTETINRLKQANASWHDSYCKKHNESLADRDRVEALRAEVDEQGKREVAAWAERDVYLEQNVKVIEMIRALRAEKAELVAALKECSDDLASEIEYHFDAVKRHSAMASKYERDMEPVKQARAVLDKVVATEKRYGK